MPYKVVDLGQVTTVTSSGGAGVSSKVGHLDDATSLALFVTSSSFPDGYNLQLSQYDPADAFPPTGATESSNWFKTTSYVISSSGGVVIINPVPFRGLRFTITTTSSGQGEILAYVTKQITV